MLTNKLRIGASPFRKNGSTIGDEPYVEETSAKKAEVKKGDDENELS